MELCSSGHDEVCYESRTCPACEIKDKLNDARMEVTALQKAVEGLEDRVDELSSELG